MTQSQASQMTRTFPLLQRLISTYVVPHWGKVVVSVVLMLFSAGLTGAMAKLMEPIIDKVFNGDNAAMLWPVAMLVLIVFALRGTTTYAYSVMMNALGQRIVSDINKDMFSHLVYADLAFMHGGQTGQFQARFLSDTAMMRNAVTETLLGLGKNTFTVIALVGVMFYQDWQLALISITVFPIAAIFVSKIGRKLRKVSTSMQEEIGRLSSSLGQALQGSRHVRAYGMEEYEKIRVNNNIENLYKLMTRTFRMSAIISPVSEMLSGLAIVAIIVYGGQSVIDGASTAGKLFSFIAAFLMAFEPLKRMAKLNGVLQMGLAAADRTFKLLDTYPLVANKPDAVDLSTTDPTIQFDNVVFAYQDGSEALRGISFTAPAGKTVALVGESGAGKSTVLSLIPRFYDVTSGAITIGGKDIRDVTLRSLRGCMAQVSQEVAIFNDTIRENIAYGSPDATDDDVISAAKAAAAHEFIESLPEGYNTYVGENGVKLSGGQRQRISIARAMLRNAPILLLDEATSALDGTSERLVQEALEKLQRDKTTIVVAHRLSTIINADVIHVMAGGKIVETGRHEELLAKGGIYTRLYGTMLKDTD